MTKAHSPAKPLANYLLGSRQRPFPAESCRGAFSATAPQDIAVPPRLVWHGPQCALRINRIAMDVHTPAQRSFNMSRIRSRDTKPEHKVRSMLHKLGYRFRLHQSNLPGHPDIVLPKYKTLIYVHGCFWHRHEGCRFATTPATNTEKWMKKFNENIARDARNKKEAQQLGWTPIVVWECETRDTTELSRRLDSLLKSNSAGV